MYNCTNYDLDPIESQYQYPHIPHIVLISTFSKPHLRLVFADVLFIAGGLGPDMGSVDNVLSTEVLDLNNSTCSRTLGDLPGPRDSHSIVSLDDGSLVLCGGWGIPSLKDRSSCITTASPAVNNTWVPHSTFTEERGDHSAVSMGQDIHLLGGAYSTGTREVYTAPPG